MFYYLLMKIFAQLNDDDHVLSLLPGHMKPFGSEGPFFHLPEIEEFPSPIIFFNKYVIPSIPVVIKGAANISVAFNKWWVFIIQLFNLCS